jgi:hypothetical protein
MKSFWSKAVVSAAAILCAGAASAAVTNIDFESVDTSGAPGAPLLTDQDYVTQSGYMVGAFDPNNSGAPNGAFVGTLMNGADSSTCLDNTCPAGNSTNFLAAVNDGFVFIGALDGSTLVLTSFDAAFIGPFAGLPGSTVAFLAIRADRADGSFAAGYFPLLGPSGGTTSFTTFNPADATLFAGSTGTLTSGHIDSLTAYAYYCGTGSSCSAASSDKAQFALDNIMIGVPEPGNWLLMTLGLGALGAASRRRRSL